jgi:hypothetical protein
MLRKLALLVSFEHWRVRVRKFRVEEKGREERWRRRCGYIVSLAPKQRIDRQTKRRRQMMP